MSSFAKYVADSMFTFFVINTLSLTTWRSTLGLYWVILAFDNPVIADVVSSAIGVGGCTLLFAMETYIARVSHVDRTISCSVAHTLKLSTVNTED